MPPPIHPSQTTPIETTATDESASTAGPEATDPPREPEAPRRPFVLEGRLSVGAAQHGGRNGTLLAVDPIGNLGDFMYYEAAASMLFDLLEGEDVQLRVGGRLSGTAAIGDENTGGSSLYMIRIGPRLEFDWRRGLWGDAPIAGPSRIGADFSIGYGGGTTTAETYSLHSQSGVDLSAGVDLNLINAQFGGVEVGLDFFVRTDLIQGGNFNTPFNAFGGALAFRTADEPPVTIEQVDECPESDLNERVLEIAEENGTLRTSYAAHREFLSALRTQLEARGIDRAELLANVRQGYREYLANRETEPVADATERERLAAERFPDNFDPFTLPDVEAVAVPGELPSDCDDLIALLNRLEDERAELNRQNGLAEGTEIAALIRQGTPPAAAPHLARAITRLQEIHFITNRPFGNPDDRGYRANADISVFDQAAQAYIAVHPPGPNGMRESRPMAELQDVFRTIFPVTRRRDSSGFHSPSLEAIAQIAEALRSPELREATFYIVGNTDSRGPDAHNQGLSLRRARSIADALILMGIPPERLVAIGRGERNLIYYFDQTGNERRPEREHTISAEERRELRQAGIVQRALTEEITGRQTTNRRVEMFVCFPQAGGAMAEGDQVCIALAQEAGGGTSPNPAPVPSPNTGVDGPVQSVQTTDRPQEPDRRQPESQPPNPRASGNPEAGE